MLAEKSPNMIFINKKGRIVYANQKCTEVMGYRQDEFYSPDFDFLSLMAPESVDRVKDRYNKHMKGEDIHPYEYSLVSKERRKIDVILASKLISYNGEEAILGIVTDITDRKQAEEALRRSEEKYRHLVENSNAVLYAADENGNMTYISPVITPMTGYDPAEIIDRHFTEFIYLEDVDRIKQQFRKQATGKGEPGEYRMLTKSRDICWIRTSSRPIFLNGRFLGVQGVMTDITDRKRAEEKLKASLCEKEAMMREIHHRVKNNMQIVSSLLRLQSKNMRSKKLRETFRIAQNRIKSMALIHEVLYRSENLEKINFSEYIKRITNHLFSIFTQEARRVQLDLDVGELYLDIDRAIPCGLIINELVSNCLKHAFPDGQSGIVQIKLANKLDSYAITIKDNGIGLPEETAPMSAETLGLQLVNDLVKQIEGKIMVRRESGTTFQITF
jgi:PAS domain S-box-containing protein